MSKEHLSQDVIDRVKSEANIVDVVKAAGIEMKRTGAFYKVLCPFHADSNPSLVINPKYNRCKCFACGEGGDPIGFVMKFHNLKFVDAVMYLAKMYNIDTFDYSCSVPSVKRTNYEVKAVPQIQTEFYDMQQVSEKQEWNGKNRLSHLSSYLIDSGFPKDVIRCVMSLYHVGVDSDGNSWFWQIDKEGRAHTAHIIPFNPKTGHRLKKSIEEDSRLLHGRIETWWAQDVEFWNTTRNMTAEAKSQVKKRFVTQCLFGEHLLNLNTCRVCIVESQKTALIMSMIDGKDKIWLATGGKSNLSVDKLKVLKGRYVMLYPDADAYWDWLDKLKEMKKILREEHNIILTIHNVRNDVEQYMKEFLKVDELPKWARKFDFADLELFKKGVWRP